VIQLKGDSAEIERAMLGTMKPVMDRKGPENGAIFHCTARTDDGLIVVNVWRDAEGSDAAFQDPEVQEALTALQGVVSAPPQRDHYDVVEYVIP
jgi:quinol monooxygenase YgiN